MSIFIKRPSKFTCAKCMPCDKIKKCWSYQFPENQRPKSLIIHVGTNDLTDDVNLLNNVKKIVNKTKEKSRDTALTFSNIIVRKDK